jgi:hypothetical protein
MEDIMLVDGPCKSTDKISEFDQVTKKMNDSLERLSADVSNIERRFGAVLRPEIPTGTQKKEERIQEVGSPFQLMMDANTSHIIELSIMIENLCSRCEI